MKKKVGIIKRVLCLCLVFLLSINSFAAIVSDNDGSAFITKAEFDALKNSFQTQIDTYNTSIDSKIDGAIASYLAGIQISNQEEIATTCGSEKSTNWRTFEKFRTNFTANLTGTDTDVSAFINGIFIKGSAGTSTVRTNLTISNYGSSTTSPDNVNAVNKNHKFAWVSIDSKSKKYLRDINTITPFLQFMAIGIDNTWQATATSYTHDDAYAPTSFTLDYSSYSSPQYFTTYFTGLWGNSKKLYCTYSLSYEDRSASLMSDLDVSLYGAVNSGNTVSYLDYDKQGLNTEAPNTWDVDKAHAGGATGSTEGGAYLWVGTQTGSAGSIYRKDAKFPINVKAKDVKKDSTTLGQILNITKTQATGKDVNYFNGIPLVDMPTGKTGKVVLTGHLTSLPTGTTHMVIKNSKFDENTELNSYTSTTAGVVLAATITAQDFSYEIPITTALTSTDSSWWIKFDNSYNNTLSFYIDPLKVTWD